MEYIYIVDLTGGEVRKVPYDILTEKDYGRGLAARLLRQHAPLRTGRFSPDNPLVFAPGLFAGCPAPSAGRMTILAKGSETEMQVSNVTGNMPQKMGSLGVCALVIKGADKAGNAVVHLSSDGVELHHMPELEGQYTETIVASLKARFGREAAIVGTGIAGDRRMSLSTMFCTYPDGEPEFACPRNGFGDIPGSKGLRAVVVTGDAYFARGCRNAASFRATGKQLAAEIIRNEVCGGALPSYGSGILIDLLQHNSLPATGEACTKQASAIDGRKVNLCCAPMCVIGCLNRHSAASGQRYDTPDQSELATILRRCFGVEDNAFLLILQRRLRSLGLVSPEFVTAARSYFIAVGISPGKAAIMNLVDQIEQNTEVGQLVASRAAGIATAFPEKAELRSLVDQPAIADENAFQVQMTQRGEQFSEVNDLEMLYRQIFVLENLGFCLFSSFALVNNATAAELMGTMFRSKTGQRSTGDDLIRYAASCNEAETEYAHLNGAESPRINLPPFTKVLYRYFSKHHSL